MKKSADDTVMQHEFCPNELVSVSIAVVTFDRLIEDCYSFFRFWNCDTYAAWSR